MITRWWHDIFLFYHNTMNHIYVVSNLSVYLQFFGICFVIKFATSFKQTFSLNFLMKFHFTKHTHPHTKLKNHYNKNMKFIFTTKSNLKNNFQKNLLFLCFNNCKKKVTKFFICFWRKKYLKFDQIIMKYTNSTRTSS